MRNNEGNCDIQFGVSSAYIRGKFKLLVQGQKAQDALASPSINALMKLLHKSSIPIHEPDYNLRLTNWNKKLIIRLSNISSTCCSLVWCPTSMFFAMKISLSCNTNFRKNFLFFGGSRRSWTLNLTVRSGTLYPIELVTQVSKSKLI